MESDRRASLPWMPLVAGMILGALLFAWRNPRWINPDCAVNLYLGDLLLNGQIPYVDFVEINPPLIMYVNTLPALVARVLDCGPILCFQGLVIAVWIISILQLRAILFFSSGPFRREEVGIILTAWSFSTICVHLQDHFGQREHLFLLFYIPFLVMRVLRHQGERYRAPLTILTGALAGIGVSLKPHYLLAAILAEALLLLIRGEFRRALDTENLALSAVVLAYVGHWLLVPAEMREAFFGRWVPLVVDGYAAYDAKGLLGRWLPMANLTWPFDTRWTRWPRILLSAGVLLAELACLGLAVRSALQPGSRFRLFLISFPALSILGLLLYWVQGKGFPYHRIPIDLPVLMTLCFLYLETSRVDASRPPSPSRSIRQGLVYAACALLTVLFFARAAIIPPREVSPAVAELDRGFRRLVEAHSGANDPILAFSTSVAPIFPTILQLDRAPGSRYIWTFPLALFYHVTGDEAVSTEYHKPDSMPLEESRFLGELRADVANRKPILVVIPNRPGGQGLPEWFNIAEYLESVGWMEAALLEYERVGCEGAWLGFRRKQSSEVPNG